VTRNAALALIAAFLAVAGPSRAAGPDFGLIEKIPIQEEGRRKPYLVFAEEALLSMSGKTRLEIDGQTRGAVDIITSIWLDPAPWAKRQLILVNHLDLKKTLGLEAARKRFSPEELGGNAAFAALVKGAAERQQSDPKAALDALQREAVKVDRRLAEFAGISSGRFLRLVPPGAGEGAPWGTIDPTEPVLVSMRQSLASGDGAAFAAAASQLVSGLALISPAAQPPGWKIDLETFYQKAHPIRWAWILYAAAGVVLLAAYRPGRRAAYSLGWVLVGAGFLCQIAGFACRALIAGRPPVTNMYESIVWVAFGTVLFALIFEARTRSGYFLLGAIPVAVVSLILADSQPLALDRSIHPLVPVLQDNFWLTIHVLTITLSYAAFALALGVAHIVLGKIIAGRKPSAALTDYVYRALQVGVLLLAAGTILGGVWANYSWGRFWDWDPKETWALIALLGYLFILHGRIAGRWGGIGISVGAVLGFLSVVMAWYGVNFVLGVGLHSYGFGSGGFGYALAYVLAELIFVAVALWRLKENSRKERDARHADGDV